MKFRADFVTNSSSSSFILAFKDQKEAYVKLCEAFLNAQEQDGVNLNEYEFNENACTLDNLVLMIKSGQLTKEEAVEKYLDLVSYYPVRYEIRAAMYKDVEHFPRDNPLDFNERYDTLIDQKRDEELSRIRTEIEEWLKDKTCIAHLVLESHWKEGEAHDLLLTLGEENMRRRSD